MTTTIDQSDDARLHTGAMDDTTDPDPEVPERARGPRRFPAAYKRGSSPGTTPSPRRTREHCSVGRASSPRSSPNGDASATGEPKRRSGDRQAARLPTPGTRRSPR